MLSTSVILRPHGPTEVCVGQDPRHLQQTGAIWPSCSIFDAPEVREDPPAIHRLHVQICPRCMRGTEGALWRAFVDYSADSVYAHADARINLKPPVDRRLPLSYKH